MPDSVRNHPLFAQRQSPRAQHQQATQRLQGSNLPLKLRGAQCRFLLPKAT
jgi:hypothetical protein